MRVFDWGKQRRAFDAVALHPNGQALAAGGNYQPTVVWDAVGGGERARFASAAYSLQFHPLDGRLFCSTSDGLQAYDGVGSALTVVLPGGQYNVAQPAFAPNEDWAVYLRRADGEPSTLAAVNGFGKPGQTTLWEVGFGDASGEPGHAWSLACLPGGERFLCAERSFGGVPHQRDRLTVRSRSDGRLLHASPDVFLGSDIRVTGSPWGEAVVVQERTWLRVYRCDDLAAPPHVIHNDKRRNFTGVAFHPSGRYLAATSNDKTVTLYDTATSGLARTFAWNIGKMRSIAFSPDGTLAAAGSDQGKVVVWDVDL